MNLNEQIRWAASRASDADLNAALETLKEHVRYRQELQQYARAGGRTTRPPWAEPGRRRRGGHVS